MNDRVSVIFPIGPNAYRASEALKDLFSQSWSDLEIIATLNGCPSEIRADFLAQNDPRLKVIDLGEKPALIEALNTAIEQSSGRWLARMDTDDRCASERIEKTMAPLLAKEAEVVSCGVKLIDALGDGMQRYVDWVNGLDQPETVIRERFIESPVVQPTVIMAKKTLLAAGGYRDDRFAEDYSLWLRLLHQGSRFSKVSETLYCWRDSEMRLTRTNERYSQKMMLALKAEALAALKSVQENGVAFCGAGPISRQLARELKARRVSIQGFFEVDPKRIGSVCQGAPIVDSQEVGSLWPEAILLSAVGTRGGRAKIRTAAREAGYVEGKNFWCCC